jgi:hypothetical protein
MLIVGLRKLWRGVLTELGWDHPNMELHAVMAQLA